MSTIPYQEPGSKFNGSRRKSTPNRINTSFTALALSGAGAQSAQVFMNSGVPVTPERRASQYTTILKGSDERLREIVMEAAKPAIERVRVESARGRRLERDRTSVLDDVEGAALSAEPDTAYPLTPKDQRTASPVSSESSNDEEYVPPPPKKEVKRRLSMSISARRKRTLSAPPKARPTDLASPTPMSARPPSPSSQTLSVPQTPSTSQTIVSGTVSAGNSPRLPKKSILKKDPATLWVDADSNKVNSVDAGGSTRPLDSASSDVRDSKMDLRMDSDGNVVSDSGGEKQIVEDIVTPKARRPDMGSVGVFSAIPRSSPPPPAASDESVSSIRSNSAQDEQPPPSPPSTPRSTRSILKRTSTLEKTVEEIHGDGSVTVVDSELIKNVRTRNVSTSESEQLEQPKDLPVPVPVAVPVIPERKHDLPPPVIEKDLPVPTELVEVTPPTITPRRSSLHPKAKNSPKSPPPIQVNVNGATSPNGPTSPLLSPTIGSPTPPPRTATSAYATKRAALLQKPGVVKKEGGSGSGSAGAGAGTGGRKHDSGVAV
ncbi:hypothetical protein HDU76_007100 [Blyttiomyces sp. JEL0837]|nr:hypothetical protein HDU76_007100 [Blyttiomyces sp. JEL0837]